MLQHVQVVFKDQYRTPNPLEKVTGAVEASETEMQSLISVRSLVTDVLDPANSTTSGYGVLLLWKQLGAPNFLGASAPMGHHLQPVQSLARRSTWTRKGTIEDSGVGWDCFFPSSRVSATIPVSLAGAVVAQLLGRMQAKVGLVKEKRQNTTSQTGSQNPGQKTAHKIRFRHAFHDQAISSVGRSASQRWSPGSPRPCEIDHTAGVELVSSWHN
jgi:hypothetical protein